MQKPPVFIITGKQGEGKTTLIEKTVGLLVNNGLNVFGFYAEGEWEEGLRSRFRLVDIQTGKKQLLCSRKGRTPQAKGTFVFYNDALRSGEISLLSGLHQKNPLAVLDEIGRFELEGKVWHKALQLLLEKKIPVLITVRSNYLEAILRHFNINQPLVFYPATPPRQVADAIMGSLGYTLE